MEIVMPGKEAKNAIHPIAIFKQAGNVWGKNLGKLSVIYLIFSLPVIFISWLPMIRTLPEQKLSLAGVFWFLFLIVIGSWRHIALLLGANQVVNAQDYTVGQSISRAETLLIKYLALMLSIILFSLGLIIIAGISVAATVALLAQVNKMLVLLIGLVLIIACIAALVFFVLRWSLAALVCVFENVRPIPALNGSLALIKEHINPVVGIYGLMGLTGLICLSPVIMFGVFSVTSANAHASSLQAGVAIYVTLINIALEPFWITLTVVLYKKLKEVSGIHVYA
jgi:hypothetical protein